MRPRYRSPPPHRHRSPHPPFRPHQGARHFSPRTHDRYHDYPHPFDIETSSLTTSSTDDPFGHETDSTSRPRRHRHRPHQVPHPPHPPHSPHHDPPLPFHNLPINLPSSYPTPPLPNDIVLLPPLLTRLHITLSTPSAPKSVHHIAPTYDLRIRDAIKNILPLASAIPLSPHLVKSYIKVRSEWWEVEAGSTVQVSDVLRLEGMVVNRKGEVDVKVIVVDEERRKGAKGWERETRKMERMRVYDL